MSRTYTALSYLRYLWNSSSWSRLHSPCLFELFSYCVDEQNRWPEFALIEAKRLEMLQSKLIISRKDFGAGSISLNTRNQTIGSIAARALSLPYQCRFMARLAFHKQPEQILELGTSLGISTLYLGLSFRVTTVEGDPAIAAVARSNFSAFEKDNIESVVSTFNDFFQSNINSASTYQLVFIDGDHRSEALLKCYEKLKRYVTKESIIVIDDLYWSKDMTHGWNTLIDKPEVMQSVDCFHFGLIFFSPDFLDKKHHVIRLPFRSVLK